MAQATILFADNDADFIDGRKPFLERAGYHVVPAGDPNEAITILKEGNVDLAILDLRLTDDQNGADRSGLSVAEATDPTVPKIILTGFPDYASVREALRPAGGTPPAAVDYVAKEERPEALVRAVHKALMGRKVFIVHGHDEGAKETVARYVHDLGLRPIILGEQPNGGRHILEKLEDYANVALALVLLTPDDVGAPRDAPDSLKPRARQNVIFELGYFIGKLGGGKVCVLRKREVEIPSDFYGIVYVEMDPGGGGESRWRGRSERPASPSACTESWGNEGGSGDAHSLCGQRPGFPQDQSRLSAEQRLRSGGGRRGRRSRASAE